MRLLLSMVLALIAVTVMLPVLQRLDEVDLPTTLPRHPGSTTPGQSAGAPETSLPIQQPRTETSYLYIWRDQKGVHIESAPPPEGVQVETMPFERSILIEPPADAETAAPLAGEAPPVSGFDPTSVYTPEGFEQLLKHIDRTAGQLRAREELLESLHEEL